MTPLFDSTGREICDLEIDGQGVDRFISKATYLDDGSDVPEEELDYVAKTKCLCSQCLENL